MIESPQEVELRVSAYEASIAGRGASVQNWQQMTSLEVDVN
jgi:hypothetical protein